MSLRAAGGGDSLRGLQKAQAISEIASSASPPRNDMDLLKPLLALIFDEVEDDFGHLDPAKIDPRFISVVCVSFRSPKRAEKSPELKNEISHLGSPRPRNDKERKPHVRSKKKTRRA